MEKQPDWHFDKSGKENSQNTMQPNFIKRDRLAPFDISVDKKNNSQNIIFKQYRTARVGI